MSIETDIPVCSVCQGYGNLVFKATRQSYTCPRCSLRGEKLTPGIYVVGSGGNIFDIKVSYDKEGMLVAESLPDLLPPTDPTLATASLVIPEQVVDKKDTVKIIVDASLPSSPTLSPPAPPLSAIPADPEGHIPSTSQSGIAGVGKDTPMVTNKAGGKQSETEYRMDRMPHRAMLAVAEVIKGGIDKYEPSEYFEGRANWTRIEERSHINHAMVHLSAYLCGDIQDDHLANAACRLLFALEVRAINSGERPTS